jgi:hypothetical protein
MHTKPAGELFDLWAILTALVVDQASGTAMFGASLGSLDRFWMFRLAYVQQQLTCLLWLQETIIGVWNEGLPFGKCLDDSLLNPNQQCWACGIEFDTCPKKNFQGKSLHGIYVL